jgi:hypothetical protein
LVANIPNYSDYWYGLTGDSIGSIYYTSSWTIQRSIPGIFNVSTIIGGSMASPIIFGGFGALRFDVNGSLYIASGSGVIKFDLLRNTC